MKNLFKYLEQNYDVNRPGDVTWSHRVNTKKKLNKAINNSSVMFIESDIRRSLGGIPVAAHPPETESDLSFLALLDVAKSSKQGLKLDFKDPEIVNVCLKILKKATLAQPIFLNADILQGNGASLSKFEAHEFIAQCKKYYPEGILSLGWTTTANTNSCYTEKNVDDMLALCKGIDHVTFPVRACLLPNSWKALSRLIRNDSYTLCVWNDEPVDEKLQRWIKSNTNPDKTFYDLIDENNEPIILA